MKWRCLMNSQLKQELLALLAKIRQETGETYRVEIERVYVQLKDAS